MARRSRHSKTRLAYNQTMHNLKKRSGFDKSWFTDRINAARETLRSYYLKLNKLTGGALGILRHAFTNFSIMRGPEAAAGLSYYALFSIFPGLLAIVSIGSMFLKLEVVKEQLQEVINQFVPVSTTFINDLISGVLDQRGAFTIVALISLLWSGSNVFDKIVINVNRAFSQGRKPGFIQSRAMALIIILVLVVLFLGSLVIDTIQGFFDLELVHFGVVFFTESVLYKWLRLLVPFLIKLLLFLVIYTFIPRVKDIRFKAKLIGAVVAAGLWELATRALTWSLSEGFTNFELIYGSLSSIIALMLWMYLSGYIIFWGAHLTYAVNYHLSTVEAMKEPSLKDEPTNSLAVNND